MDVIIHKTHYIGKRVFEGSKSLTHRFLIASFLLNKAIYLDNVANNDDIDATINFLKAIGKEIIHLDEYSLYVKKSNIKKLDTLEIDVKGSASTLRFLLPVSLNLAKKVIFHVNDSLINRPIDEYKKLMDKCNLSIKVENNSIICSGNMNLDYYEIDGNVSSQYLTGLIINALYLNRPITIKVNEPFYSKQYGDMSVDVFNSVGFDITYENNTYYIHNNRNDNFDNFTIEGDYSSAANFIVLASLNGQLIAKKLNEISLQPDKVIVDLIKSIGGNIHFIENGENKELFVQNSSLLEKGFYKQLRNFEIDINNCIDLGPILMVLASFSKGTSIIKNVSRLAIKESNRLQAMYNSLKSLGVDIKLKDNDIIINGKKDYNNVAILSSYNDHRIAMALTIFATLNNGQITIKDVQCINKSDPNFFNELIKGCKDNSIKLI